MLNELSELAESLARIGIALPPNAPQVKRPARADAFWVRLDGRGEIGNVGHLSADRMAELWTIREGKQNSFPVIRFKEPARPTAASDPLREKLGRVEAADHRTRCALLAECLSSREPPALPGVERLWQRLKKKTNQLAGGVDPTDAQLGAWKALLERFSIAPASGVQFLEAVASSALDACSRGQLDCIGLLETLIVGKLERGQKGAGAGVPIFLDVEDFAEFQWPVAHPRMGEAVAAAMRRSAPASRWQGACALTGHVTSLETDLFPAPNLPVLGETYLLSMNQDARCQTRYGLTGTRVLPVSKDRANEVEQALKWVTHEDREGKTWRRVPGGRGASDLLLAYLPQRPEIDARLASLFSWSLTELERDPVAPATFEAACESVLRSLDAQKVTGASKVQLLVLGKVDPGRAQLVLSRELTVSRLTKAAEEWANVGCANLPRIVIDLSQARTAPRAMRPPVLFPDAPVRVLSRQWQRNASSLQKGPTCNLQEAFDLFLPPPEGCKRTALRLLRLALQRGTSLIAGVGGARALRGKRAFRSASARPEESCAELVTLLAVLLYRLHRTKEVYMSDGAYRLGELLALADSLHAEYCRVRRKGSYPPQLLGNALLPAAASNPVRAVARLSERLRVYQAWARTTQGDEIGLAKWLLGRLGEASRALHASGLSERLGDTGKAELLLGYLARPERVSTSGPAEATSTNDPNGDTDHV